jgi:hypothetical protein
MELLLDLKESGGTAVLTSTQFIVDGTSYNSYRGKDTSLIGTGSFTWTSAVQGLVALFMRHHIFGSTELGKISGGPGSLAASLDYAISKQPRWLSDMFGVRDRGTPNIRYILTRSNSGRKRPGPVEVAVRPSSKVTISVVCNNKPVTSDEELRALLKKIEGSEKNNDSVSPESESKIDMPGGGGVPDECPYPGLRCFGEDDISVFFGRDQEREEILSAIYRCPSVVLFGSSGSGKSSLFNAGIIPCLRSHSHDDNRWNIIQSRPKRNPIYEILRTRLSELDLKRVNGDSRGQAAIFRELVRASSSDRNHTLLLVDQAEELFTESSPEAAEQFLATLSDLIEEIPSFHVAIGIRSDFIGYLMDSTDGAMRQSALISLSRMQSDVLQSAIEIPARQRGVFVEDRLIRALVDDVGLGNGQLPLLQFVLREIWFKRSANRLTLDNYEKIGGIKGALADHCEAIYQRCSIDQQNLFAGLISDLVHIDTSTGAVTKRTKVFTHSISADLRALIDALADNRILIKDEGPSKDSFAIEFVHETIISAWQRIADIVNYDKEFLLWRNHIAARTVQFEGAERDEEYLLGPEGISKALSWKTLYDRLEEKERVFIEASIAYQDKVRRKESLDKIALILQALKTTDIERIAIPIEQISRFGPLGVESIQSAIQETRDRLELTRLRIALVVLGVPDVEIGSLVDELIGTTSPGHVAIVASLLEGVAPSVCKILWQVLDSEAPSEKFLRASALLSMLSATSTERWTHYAESFLEKMCSLSPSEVAPWVEYLTPIRVALKKSLRFRIQDSSGESNGVTERFVFAKLYGDSDESLLFLALNANATDIRAILRMVDPSSSKAPTLIGMCEDERRNRLTDRAMNAIVRAIYSALTLGENTISCIAGDLLDEPECLSRLLIFCRNAGWPPIDLVSTALSPKTTSAEKYLLLAIASHHLGMVTESDREILCDIYGRQSDSGIHAVLGLILDRLGIKSERQVRERELTAKGGGSYCGGGWMLVEIGSHVVEFCRYRDNIWIANTPITVSQFAQFRSTKEMDPFASYMPEPECPVVGISWHDAVDYAEWVSDQHKALGIFRLPYDKEWVGAATQSSRDPYWFGSSIDAFPFFGWYFLNAGNSTQPVRSLVPSPKGLFDIHGNVWEWCADICSQDGANLSEVFGRGAEVTGDSRILRGGSWSDSPNWCSLRTASNPHWPADRGFMFGARLVLERRDGSE